MEKEIIAYKTANDIIDILNEFPEDIRNRYSIAIQKIVSSYENDEITNDSFYRKILPIFEDVKGLKREQPTTQYEFQLEPEIAKMRDLYYLLKGGSISLDDALRQKEELENSFNCKTCDFIDIIHFNDYLESVKYYLWVLKSKDNSVALSTTNSNNALPIVNNSHREVLDNFISINELLYFVRELLKIELQNMISSVIEGRINIYNVSTFGDDILCQFNMLQYKNDSSFYGNEIELTFVKDESGIKIKNNRPELFEKSTEKFYKFLEELGQILLLLYNYKIEDKNGISKFQINLIIDLKNIKIYNGDTLICDIDILWKRKDLQAMDINIASKFNEILDSKIINVNELPELILNKFIEYRERKKNKELQQQPINPTLEMQPSNNNFFRRVLKKFSGK